MSTWGHKNSLGNPKLVSRLLSGGAGLEAATIAARMFFGGVAHRVSAHETVKLPPAMELGVFDSVVQLFGAGSTPARVTLNTTFGRSWLMWRGGKLSDQLIKPTDNQGNTFTQIGIAEEYLDWSGYGSTTWLITNGVGGTNHNFDCSVTNFDEHSVVVAEFSGQGLVVEDMAVKHVANSGGSGSLTADPVITAGPAYIIAIWGGSGPVGAGNHVVTANNGFTLLESFGTDDPNGYVQFYFFAKRVTVGGTYDVTFTQTPSQGAIMTMIALSCPEGETLSGVHAGGGPIDYPEGLPESVAVSEARTTVVNFIIGLGESVALSEALASARAAIVGVAENPALSESLASSRAAIVALAENPALSESIAASRAIQVAIAEGVSLAEILAAVVNAVVAPSETVTLSEALAASAARIIALAEGVSLVEGIAASRAAIVATAETVTLSDGFASSAAFNLTPAETVTLVEAIAAGLMVNADLADVPMTYSEALTSAMAAIASLADGVSLAEAVQSLQSGAPADYIEGVSETVAWLEAVSVAVAHAISISEGVSSSESLAARRDTFAITAETVSLSDSLDAEASNDPTGPVTKVGTVSVTLFAHRTRSVLSARSEANAKVEESTTFSVSIDEDT